MFGDFLYQLSLKDQKSLGIQIFRDRVSFSGGVTSIKTYAQVPIDRVLILQTISVVAAPEAVTPAHANFCRVCTGSWVSENAEPSILSYLAISDRGITEFTSSGYTSNVYYQFEFDNMLIPAGAAIGATTIFNTFAGGNNSVDFHVNGYTIPRGNIAF